MTLESVLQYEGWWAKDNAVLRVVACGNAVSLALDSKLVEGSRPSPAQQYAKGMTLESVLQYEGWWWEKDNAVLRTLPCGSLPMATLSRLRSTRTLSKVLDLLLHSNMQMG